MMKKVVSAVEMVLGCTFIVSTLAAVYVAKNYGMPVGYVAAIVLFIAALGLLID